jgi:hypothetical protein
MLYSSKKTPSKAIVLKTFLWHHLDMKRIDLIKGGLFCGAFMARRRAKERRRILSWGPPFYMYKIINSSDFHSFNPTSSLYFNGIIPYTNLVVSALKKRNFFRITKPFV